jgi:predicted transcriptional regulator
MVKYRRRFEIIADVISAAEKGAKKTRIMYFANLSYRLLQKYLGDTVKVGFIRESGGGYESTEKGRIFLERYTEFSGKYSKLVNDFEALKFEMEVLERMCTSIREDESKSNNARRKLSELLH